MKKSKAMNRIILITAGAICVSGMLASCGQGFSTQSYETDKSFPLTEERTDSLEMEIEVEYPVSGLDEDALANMSMALTARLFGEQYAAMPAQQAMDAYTEDKVNEYREVNMPLISEDGILDWVDYTYGSISGGHKNIISYLVTKYVYTGGAHGMTSEISCNFDRKTGTLLTEGDFFKGDYKEKLGALLTKYLADTFENSEDLSMLFSTEIEPNGNFSVSKKGVTYIYNQYEIAPYSMGIIRVTVPWKELKGMY